MIDNLLNVLISAVKFFGVLSVLILVHEFGHFIVARRSGVRVEMFSLGFGKKLFSKKGKETEYSIAAVPFGGFVKLAGDNLDEFKSQPHEYLSKPVIKRFGIIFAGPLMNYLLGILLFWAIFFVGYPSFTTKVGFIDPSLGASQAGIQVGDRITAIESKPVKLWDELVDAIRANKDKAFISVKVLRAEEELEFSVKLKEQEMQDILKQKRKVGLIGVGPDPQDVIKIRHGIFSSLSLAVNKSWELTAVTYKALWFIVTRKIPARESVTGPVGIWDLVSKTSDFMEILLLMAILSLSLAIFNLLPFPALDGGHIVLLVVEKIRGRYLSKKAEEIFSRIGFTFIIVLAVLVFYNDLVRKGVLPDISQLFKH